MSAFSLRVWDAAKTFLAISLEKPYWPTSVIEELCAALYSVCELIAKYKDKNIHDKELTLLQIKSRLILYIVAHFYFSWKTYQVIFAAPI